MTPSPRTDRRRLMTDRICGVGEDCILRTLISVEAAAGTADLAEFHTWLQGTPQVTRTTDLSPHSTGRTGAMSTGDAVALATSSVAALTAVIQAYAAWRAARPAAPHLLIEIEGIGMLTVTRGSFDEIALVVRALEEAEASGPAAGPPPGEQLQEQPWKQP
jgi:hypothetical protein